MGILGRLTASLLYSKPQADDHPLKVEARQTLDARQAEHALLADQLALGRAELAKALAAEEGFTKAAHEALSNGTTARALAQSKDVSAATWTAYLKSPTLAAAAAHDEAKYELASAQAAHNVESSLVEASIEAARKKWQDVQGVVERLEKHLEASSAGVAQAQKALEHIPLRIAADYNDTRARLRDPAQRFAGHVVGLLGACEDLEEVFAFSHRAAKDHEAAGAGALTPVHPTHLAAAIAEAMHEVGIVLNVQQTTYAVTPNPDSKTNGAFIGSPGMAKLLEVVASAIASRNMSPGDRAIQRHALDVARMANHPEEAKRVELKMLADGGDIEALRRLGRHSEIDARQLGVSGAKGASIVRG